MIDIMALSASNVDGARLFSDREHLVAAIGPLKAGKVAEIGVAFGYGSRMLVQRFQPKEFHAIDLFNLHEHKVLWGGQTSKIFKGSTHLQWYEENYSFWMRGLGTQLITRQGQSFDALSAYSDHTFDVIYIDGAHQYEYVKKDAEAASHKLTNDGILIFNDYIIADPETKEFFGVVPVVNELVERHGWKILGLGLHPQMYCDIALARR